MPGIHQRTDAGVLRIERGDLRPDGHVVVIDRNFRFGKTCNIKRALRGEFAQEQVYIRGRMRRAELVDKVLRLFNGVNACEVARTLNISRATVYRSLKQPGKT